MGHHSHHPHLITKDVFTSMLVNVNINMKYRTIQQLDFYALPDIFDRNILLL